MAEIYTSYFGGSTSPRVRLVYNITSQTGGAATITWILDYVPTSGYPASTNGTARNWTIAIDGQIRSGSYNINGVSGATRISTGTITVNKQGSARNISLSASFGFNLTWSGTYAGTLTTTGTLKIDAKQSSTVSYNANGGSGAPGSQTKWYGEILTLSSTRPTRSGYTFVGWATSSGGSAVYQPGGKYGDDKSVTLYAVWSTDSYIITYNANGGSGAPAAGTKKHGSVFYISQTKPTRSGYTFVGWGTSSASSTVAYEAGALYIPDASIDLYAIWKVAYNPPRIVNIKMDRCDSAGTLKDDGTYILVTCSWATDVTANTMYIRYKRSDSSSWSVSSYTLSGTSGYVSKVVGSGSVDVEYIYNVQIEIKDSSGSTIANQDVSAMKYIIDFKSGGTGIAIGKAATTDNLFEVALPTQFTGGIEYIQIPSGKNLNDYKTPGFYRITSNSIAAQISNTPVNSAASVEIGINASGPTGVYQRYIVHDTTKPNVYIRNFWNNTWSSWERVLFVGEFNTYFDARNGTTFHTKYMERLKANTPTFKGEITFPYGITGSAYKIGYFVTINFARQSKTFSGSGENKSASETLPTWAKPVSNTTFNLNRSSGGGVVTWPLSLHLNTDGTITYSSYGTGTHVFSGSVTYMCSNAD